MNKDVIIADAMEFATKLTVAEFGPKNTAKGLHFEYRQGAMDATITILNSITLSDEQYNTLMKQLGIVNE